MIVKQDATKRIETMVERSLQRSRTVRPHSITYNTTRMRQSGATRGKRRWNESYDLVARRVPYSSDSRPPAAGRVRQRRDRQMWTRFGDTGHRRPCAPSDPNATHMMRSVKSALQGQRATGGSVHSIDRLADPVAHTRPSPRGWCRDGTSSRPLLLHHGMHRQFPGVGASLP